MTPQSNDVQNAVAAASENETARIVATLIRVTGDWPLAEDCVQDALARALVEWPRSGIPTVPGAWLTTVARNRARDLLRRAATEATALRRHVLLAEVDALIEDDACGTHRHSVEDDRLRLIFTCCHPALPMEGRIALTLRTVVGLTTGEIARAFNVSEPTMAKRLVRARAKIRDAGIPYRVPPPELLPERTTGVLAVVYLLFNEGYSATGGPTLIRASLALRAIRLTRLLVALLDESPHASEAVGLLALMLFHHARRDARLDAAGDLVTLENQDRALWDQSAISEGIALLRLGETIDGDRGQRAGGYRLQAAIAECHVIAPDAGSTDFARITRLYDELALLIPSPIVALNRAAAVAMSQGPKAGLLLIDDLERAGTLDRYHLLPATKADLLRRLGRTTEAADAYQLAYELARSDVERRYLGKRLRQCSQPRSQSFAEPPCAQS